MKTIIRRVSALLVSAWAPLVSGVPCVGFADVDAASAFCTNVEWIKNRGITVGCAPGLYCPDQLVTRLSMAVFLNRTGDVLLPPAVVWVAMSGGMFGSVQSAIDYAAARAGPATPYLVRIAPGDYIGQVTLKDYVDVEGSGEGVTVLRADTPGGTIVAGANAELRRLTVVNNAALGASSYPDGATIMQTSGSSRFSHVTAMMAGTGEMSLVVYILGGVARFDHATLTASGGSVIAYAAYARDAGALTLVDSTLNAQSTLSAVGAVALTGGSIQLRGCEVRSNAEYAHGVGTTDGAVTLAQSTVTVSGSADSIGAHLWSGSIDMDGVTLASGGGSTRTIVVDEGNLNVRASRVLSPAGLYHGAVAVYGGTVRFAHTQIVGPIAGPMTCFGTYDGNMMPLAC